MSRRPSGLWKPNLELTICVLVGRPQAVSLDGDELRGEWGPIRRIRPSEKLVQEFLNWPVGPEDVLRFTERYGPLFASSRYKDRDIPWRPERGGVWNFSLTHWRDDQTNLRERWERVAGLRQIVPDSSAREIEHRLNLPKGALSGTLRPISPHKLSETDLLEFNQETNQIALVLGNMRRFLAVSMTALPWERMRKCKRPTEEGCDIPYFVARHRRQEYCSDVCAHWGQKEAKKHWWKNRQASIKEKTTKGGKKR